MAKFIMILLFCTVMQAGAAVYAQRASIKAEHITLKDVFSELREQTGYHFLYVTEDLENTGTVSLNFNDAALETILEKCFEGKSLKYEIKGNRVLVERKVDAVVTPLTQQIKVSGKISDEGGNPLEGVTVRVKGTKQASLTDSKGNYKITLSAIPATLQFSIIGFNIEEKTVNSASNLNLTLTRSNDNLDEIVVVGYGKQKKSSMTAAVSAVQGETLKKVGPVANISNTLGGNISGLITRQTSGEPGSDASSVLLRGNTPLVLVDGVERNWDRINMQDVESVSVLKDASAVAPYGLKGANGVILVTTKRGNPGRMVLGYSGEYGFQSPINTPQFMDAYDGLKLRNEALIMDGKPNEVISNDVLEQYRHGNDAYPNTDWVKEYLRSSRTQNHNVSLNGGTENVRAFVSMGYLNQGSMYGDDQDYHRYNLRSNLDIKATPTTMVSVDMSLIGDEKKGNYLSSSDIMLNVYRLRPTEANVYSNGLPAYQTSIGGSMYNLVHGGGDQSSKNNNQSINLTLKQYVPFISGLSLKGFFNYDRQANEYKNWGEPVISYNFNSATGEFVEDNAWLRSKPTLSQGNRVYAYSTVQGFVNYENTFNEQHHVSGMVVYERRWGGRTEYSASRQQYDFTIPELNMGSPNKEYQANAGTSNQTAQDGWIFRGNYDFNQKYLIEVAGRYDRTYKYAPGRRSAFFPSASLGWRISSEPFFHSESINDLKLRVSYGKSGNPVGGDFAYLQQYVVTNGPVWGVDPLQEQAVYEGVEPNTRLTWETVDKANIGLDLTMWNGWLGLTLDLYHDFRKDQILAPDAVVPIEYGVGLADENAGKNERYGFDATISSQGTAFGNLHMKHQAVIGFTRDKRLEIREAAGTYNVPRFRLTGNPSSQLRGYKSAGLFKDQEDIDNWAFQSASVLPGDIKYVDINGDGKINSEDQVIIGKTTTPEIMWGYNLTLDYKGFDFNAFFQGTLNSSYYLGAADRGVRFPFDNDKPLKDHINSWTVENPDPNAKYPRLSYSKRTQNYETSDFWVVNTAYVRLKSVQLGYTLKPELSKKAFINNLRLYVNLYNPLIIFSKMPRDFDVESLTYNTYPQQFITSIGLNATF